MKIIREKMLIAALAACLARFLLARPCDCAAERQALLQFYDEALAEDPAP